MLIESLIRIIAPPLSPSDPATAQGWAAAEAELGTKLPAEYFEYCRVYGSGTFQGDEYTSLTLFNPCSPADLLMIRSECDRLSDAIEHGHGADLPLKVFPEIDGLLMLGVDEHNVRLTWQTHGVPDKWPVVIIWERGLDGHERVNLSLVELLSGLLTRKTFVAGWPEPFFLDNVRFARRA